MDRDINHEIPGRADLARCRTGQVDFVKVLDLAGGDAGLLVKYSWPGEEIILQADLYLQ